MTLTLPNLQLAKLSMTQCAAAALAMMLAAAMAVLATPRLQAVAKAPDLAAVVPTAFGDWKAVPDSYAQVSVAQGVETTQEQPYDQTVMRTYVNRAGQSVMLALAWGERQRQDVKVHRPEVCYPAQGYSVVHLATGAAITLPGRAAPVPTTALLAVGRSGLEAVRYWIRIGEIYGGDGLAARWYILKEGLRGRIPDGMLVRASQRLRTVDDMPKSQAQMEQFLADLTSALPPATLSMLVR